jgi:hypothetical protein
MPDEEAGLRMTIEIGLNAAIVAMIDRAPCILAVTEAARPHAEAISDAARDALPFGPFDPAVHRTFETSLRARVEQQTALDLGYIEQLYTFGDRGRQRLADEDGLHMVSVGYLALTRTDAETADRLSETGARWRAWYDYLPWEDWRHGRPAIIDRLLPSLARWEEASLDAAARRARLRLAFGLDDFPWDEERVLERYELLYEAGLVEEALTDGRMESASTGPASARTVFVGQAMLHDHRRIVATAIARLRGKIKYRPVIFELMPPEFTLTDLQAAVEAISGRLLHKQNFRRLVEGASLVEPTGMSTGATGGRPAALFRFRRRILEERPAPGLRLGA